MRTRNGRFMLTTGQRSAGRHLVGPVFGSADWHNYKGVRYVNLTIGNPRVHYRWAFSVWVYLSLGRRWRHRIAADGRTGVDR